MISDMFITYERKTGGCSGEPSEPCSPLTRRRQVLPSRYGHLSISIVFLPQTYNHSVTIETSQP